MRPRLPIFIGRENELSEIIKKIEYSRKGITKTALLITGIRRVGKTALLLEVLSRVKGIYIDCEAVTTPGQLLDIFLRELAFINGKWNISLERMNAEMIDKVIFGGKLTIPHEKTYTRAFEAIYSLSYEYGVEVIVFDEFQELLARVASVPEFRKIGGARAFLSMLRGFIQSYPILTIMATSLVSYTKRILEREGELLSVQIETMEIKPLDEDVMRRLIISYSNYLGKRVDKNAIRKIVEISSGIPYYALRLLDLLENNDVDSAFLKMIRSRALFEPYVRRTIKNLGSETLLYLLQLIARGFKKPSQIQAQTGYSETSIRTMLSRLQQTGLIELRKATYYVVDPVLAVWLATHDIFASPPPTRDILAELQIGFEARVRLLVQELENMEIYDVDGSLFGHPDMLVKFHKYTNVVKRVPKGPDTDVVGIRDDKILVVECKRKGRQASQNDLNQLKKYMGAIKKLGYTVEQGWLVSPTGFAPVLFKDLPESILLISKDGLNAIVAELHRFGKPIPYF